MKKNLFLLCLALLGACSSNDNYRLVKVLNDGGEKTETFYAENDSAAFSFGFQQMMADQGRTFKKAYIINAEGDTINSEKNLPKLMKSVLGNKH